MPRRKPPEEVELWERQPEESTDAFAAFQIYRDMTPKRSVRSTGKKLGKSEGLLERWCSRWNWVERCRAWDNELFRRKQEAEAAAIKEMNERFIKTGRLLQQKALQALSRLNPEEMDENLIVKFLEAGARLEKSSHTEKQAAAVESASLADAIITAYQSKKS